MFITIAPMASTPMITATVTMGITIIIMGKRRPDHVSGSCFL
jgi:hypothetical protein